MVADVFAVVGQGHTGAGARRDGVFRKPAHHIGFAMDDYKYLSALGHKWGTIVSSVAGNSGFRSPRPGSTRPTAPPAAPGRPAHS